jgi:NAD+ dependent glucose-6-phosphate dehydrogenase
VQESVVELTLRETLLDKKTYHSWRVVMPRKVLITGANGVIGTILREGLSPEQYEIRGIDRTPGAGVDAVDITDMDAMLAACQGIDIIIHLAASADPNAPWEDVLRNNIRGTYTVLEAAVRTGVKKVIFTSSSHAISGHEAPGVLLDDVTHHPGNLYGWSKCAGEDLARLYSQRMRIIVLRIGAINREDDPLLYADREDPARLLALWLSQRDALHLFEMALAADVQWGVFYGTSDNDTKLYSLDLTREELRYDPQDNSSRYRPGGGDSI